MATRRLNLSVQYAAPRDGLPERTQVRTWVRAALDADGPRGGQITVRLCAADEARELNRDFRGKDYATNVLSFPYALEPVVCGDLVLCPEVVAREAAEQGKSGEEHYAHLIVHGILHLLGYDHVDSRKEARRMEARECEILAGLGYRDPYESEGRGRTA